MRTILLLLCCFLAACAGTPDTCNPMRGACDYGADAQPQRNTLKWNRTGRFWI